MHHYLYGVPKQVVELPKQYLQRQTISPMTFVLCIFYCLTTAASLLFTLYYHFSTPNYLFHQVIIPVRARS
jgi:hypothetical protein